jgi:lipopolysaccharide/colanic/teichoic acid biosynthesis glycosyltransferase
MTGLWQVLGHNEIPFGEMVALDREYVTSWSVRNDFRLLLRTLPLVWRGDPGRY